MTAAEAVAQLSDGATLGIGGWGARRKPMALVREILRSGLKDLTVISYGGPDVGLLAAAGRIKKLVFGFVTLDLIPLDAHFRKARQAGAFEVMELDEGMFQWGLRAACLRLPFLPTRAGLATDVAAVNPGLRTVRSPYDDGETLMAMPALELDAAVIHVDQADERGNGQILGPDAYFDDLFCGAAKKVYMSCERVVATERLLKDGCVHTLAVNRSLVSGVVEAPFGAHPTSCVPGYGIDRDHLEEYNAAAASEDAWAAYSSRYLEKSAGGYLKAAGGRERISAIEAPVF
jgi:glutaconate CoA-transferase subunit A